MPVCPATTKGVFSRNFAGPQLNIDPKVWKNDEKNRAKKGSFWYFCIPKKSYFIIAKNEIEILGHFFLIFLFSSTCLRKISYFEACKIDVCMLLPINHFCYKVLRVFLWAGPSITKLRETHRKERNSSKILIYGKARALETGWLLFDKNTPKNMSNILWPIKVKNLFKEMRFFIYSKK